MFGCRKENLCNIYMQVAFILDYLIPYKSSVHAKRPNIWNNASLPKGSKHTLSTYPVRSACPKLWFPTLLWPWYQKPYPNGPFPPLLTVHPLHNGAVSYTAYYQSPLGDKSYYTRGHRFCCRNLCHVYIQVTFPLQYRIGLPHKSIAFTRSGPM